MIHSPVEWFPEGNDGNAITREILAEAKKKGNICFRASDNLSGVHTTHVVDKL